MIEYIIIDYYYATQNVITQIITNNSHYLLTPQTHCDSSRPSHKRTDNVIYAAKDFKKKAQSKWKALVGRNRDEDISVKIEVFRQAPSPFHTTDPPIYTSVPIPYC